MKSKIILILALLFAAPAFAQSITPLVVECGKKCNGSFTVSNEMLEPMGVVVEPFSFSLGPKSETLFRPLDKTVDVELHENSARLGPHDSRTFDYSIRCTEAPCLVALTTGMVVGHTKNGIALRLVIPHIVYSCSTGKDCRKNVRLAAGLER